MHVFHVITTLDKGGAESHLVELCREQVARGLDLSVAYLKGDGYWAPTLEDMGVRTIALSAARYADPGAVTHLVRATKRAAPDIVHAHMPPAELYCNFVIRRSHSPCYVVSKHIDRFRFYAGPGSDWLERFCAQPAEAVICISQAVNNYFADRWPEALRRKLVTIRYGMEPLEDTPELAIKAQALRREWGVAEDDVLFGIAARFVEQKSIDTLLRAFAELLQSAPAPVRLAIVGRGPLEASLRSLANDLGIGDKVVWGGFRTDIPVVMRAFDVFTLSSIYEGFGLVLLEAMDASRAVVASGISAIPEVVADGVTGLLVPPEDPGRLAGAMRRLVDGRVRAEMGARGRRRLIEAFGVKRMAASTLYVYDSALQAHRA
jgi:glycosyltransferase involved in cell wall biosynthesis